MTIDNKNEQKPDKPIPAAANVDDDKDRLPNNGKEITEKVLKSQKGNN